MSTETQIPDRSTPAFRKYAAEVMLSDGPWEIYIPESDEWGSCNNPCWDWWKTLYRIAPPPPAPQWKPWTFETAPMERLKVRRKKDGSLFVAEAQPSKTLIIGPDECCGSVYSSYADLLRDFEALDGTPLGVKVEEEWPKYFTNKSRDTVWTMHEHAGTSRDIYGSVLKSTCRPEDFPSDRYTRITAAEAAALLAKGKQV